MINTGNRTSPARGKTVSVPPRQSPDHTYIEGARYILVDMDGTLLDRHFDDYFWEEYVPAEYGRKNGLTPQKAASTLLNLYREKEGTLEWTDLDYWSERLGLDIPALKQSISQRISILPHAEEFLRHCRGLGKTTILVTNAHPKTLAIKIARTGIDNHLDQMICADELGMAKEDLDFWPRLMEKLKISPGECFLADDNHQVLSAAAAAGITRVVEISRPSSRGTGKPSGRFPAIENFSRLMDIAASHKGSDEETTSPRDYCFCGAR